MHDTFQTLVTSNHETAQILDVRVKSIFGIYYISHKKNPKKQKKKKTNLKLYQDLSSNSNVSSFQQQEEV